MKLLSSLPDILPIPRHTGGTGWDAPSASIQSLHPMACLRHQVLQVLPAVPVLHLPRILGDAGALRCSQRSSSALCSWCTGCPAPSQVHSPNGHNRTHTLAIAHPTNLTGEVLLAPVGMGPFLNLEDAAGSCSVGIV